MSPSVSFSYLLSANIDRLNFVQEVDRLEKLIPAIEKSGYGHHYAMGPGKRHGCLIGYKTDLYSMHANKLILYDEEDLRDTGDVVQRRGSSFLTKNIASLVALKSKTNEGQGIIVGTTHLFWHPGYGFFPPPLFGTSLLKCRYVYERARYARMNLVPYL